jgi:DNA repair protein RadC
MNTPQISIHYSGHSNLNELPQVTSVDAAVDILRPYFVSDMETRECCYAIILNTAARVLGVVEISKGTITSSQISGRMVAQACLLANGTGVIVAHNHPSGRTNPSQSDESVTKKLKQCLLMLEIDLKDHIILTRDDYYSFAREGAL